MSVKSEIERLIAEARARDVEHQTRYEDMRVASSVEQVQKKQKEAELHEKERRRVEDIVKRTHLQELLQEAAEAKQGYVSISEDALSEGEIHDARDWRVSGHFVRHFDVHFRESGESLFFSVNITPDFSTQTHEVPDYYIKFGVGAIYDIRKEDPYKVFDPRNSDLKVLDSLIISHAMNPHRWESEELGSHYGNDAYTGH